MITNFYTKRPQSRTTELKGNEGNGGQKFSVCAPLLPLAHCMTDSVFISRASVSLRVDRITEITLFPTPCTT